MSNKGINIHNGVSLILYIIAITGLIYTIKWGTLFVVMLFWNHLYKFHPEIYIKYRDKKYENPSQNITNFPTEFKN